MYLRTNACALATSLSKPLHSTGIVKAALSMVGGTMNNVSPVNSGSQRGARLSVESSDGVRAYYLSVCDPTELAVQSAPQAQSALEEGANSARVLYTVLKLRKENVKIRALFDRLKERGYQGSYASQSCRFGRKS